MNDLFGERALVSKLLKLPRQEFFAKNIASLAHLLGHQLFVGLDATREEKLCTKSLGVVVHLLVTVLAEPDAICNVRTSKVGHLR